MLLVPGSDVQDKFALYERTYIVLHLMTGQPV